MRRRLVPVLLLLAVGTPAHAQVRVSPTGVSVNAMAATTVLLTFGGIGSMIPREAVWCGELVSAAPDLGRRCDPATIFGVLPPRSDLSRTSARRGALTDIMSIPASVARRAWQAAADGARSPFFYVRRFESTTGGPDEYVVVTCRLTGGGAHVPFSLVDVRVAFDPDATVLYVAPGEPVAPVAATIRYNGTGRLVGRWEVVLPGEEPPRESDLLTEATLPPDERGTQRRWLPVERFNVFLPPGGRARLPGPDPARLPSSAQGTYLLLLRVEASDDREGDTDLAAVGAGDRVAHGGAGAGVPRPVRRYVVGTGESALAATETPRALRLVAPADGATIGADSMPTLRWMEECGAAVYRVELATDDGTPLLEALVRKSRAAYAMPPLVRERAGDARALKWRVVAIDANGTTLKRSGWRTLRLDSTTKR